MHIKAYKGKNIIVIAPVGNVDSASAPQLNSALSQLLEQKEENIVLNLKDVPFMDSTGLASIVNLLKRIQKAQKDIKISAPSPIVSKLLHLTRLEKVFEIFDTQEDAINSF